MKTSTLIFGLLFIVLAQSVLLSQPGSAPYNLTWEQIGTGMDYEDGELTIDVRVLREVFDCSAQWDTCLVAFYLTEDQFIDPLDQDIDIYLGEDRVHYCFPSCLMSCPPLDDLLPRSPVEQHLGGKLPLAAVVLVHEGCVHDAVPLLEVPVVEVPGDRALEPEVGAFELLGVFDEEL